MYLECSNNVIDNNLQQINTGLSQSIKHRGTDTGYSNNWDDSTISLFFFWQWNELCLDCSFFWREFFVSSGFFLVSERFVVVELWLAVTPSLWTALYCRTLHVAIKTLDWKKLQLLPPTPRPVRLLPLTCPSSIDGAFWHKQMACVFACLYTSLRCVCVWRRADCSSATIALSLK